LYILTQHTMPIMGRLCEWCDIWCHWRCFGIKNDVIQDT